MKVSELIRQLVDVASQEGDLDVYMDVNTNGLIAIGEVGVDAEDTGIILWNE